MGVSSTSPRSSAAMMPPAVTFHALATGVVAGVDAACVEGGGDRGRMRSTGIGCFTRGSAGPMVVPNSWIIPRVIAHPPPPSPPPPPLDRGAGAPEAGVHIQDNHGAQTQVGPGRGRRTVQPVRGGQARCGRARWPTAAFAAVCGHPPPPPPAPAQAPTTSLPTALLSGTDGEVAPARCAHVCRMRTPPPPRQQPPQRGSAASHAPAGRCRSTDARRCGCRRSRSTDARRCGCRRWRSSHQRTHRPLPPPRPIPGSKQGLAADGVTSVVATATERVALDDDGAGAGQARWGGAAYEPHGGEGTRRRCLTRHRSP
jgi:hypothetical protein